MALHAKTCDPRRLDLFLHDRLPEDARHDLEAHLLMCPACRDRLDEMAGGTRWWDQVRKNLGGDGAAESWETANLDWPAPAFGTIRMVDFGCPRQMRKVARHCLGSSQRATRPVFVERWLPRARERLSAQPRRVLRERWRLRMR